MYPSSNIETEQIMEIIEGEWNKLWLGIKLLEDNKWTDLSGNAIDYVHFFNDTSYYNESYCPVMHKNGFWALELIITKIFLHSTMR